MIGSYLHSHIQTYPSGSLQQQMTCCGYTDNNSKWVIQPTTWIVSEGFFFFKKENNK